jgi:hypothetical protein
MFLCLDNGHYILSVIHMNSHASKIPSEFDAFLFAPIGDDNDNGMQLSVLSALARQDVDPWEDAARLAVLSREAATHKLTAWIAALPQGKSPRPDPESIATRLVALLPRRTASGARAAKTILNAEPAVQSWRHLRVMIYVISMMLMLVAQWMLASHLVTRLSANTAAPISRARSSQPLSPSDAPLEKTDRRPGLGGVSCRGAARQRTAC